MNSRVYLLLVVLLTIASRAAAWIQLPTWATDLYHLRWSPYQTDLIEDCSDDSYALDIRDITLTPEFPQPGRDLLIEAEAVLKEPVYQGAYVDVTVKLGVITLIRKTFDICEEMEKNDVLDCPVNDGVVKISKTVTLPKEIPKAEFRVYAQAYNHDDSDLACLKAHVDFRKSRRFGLY